MQINTETFPSGDIIEIDGLRFSRQFFEALANPNPMQLYRLERRGDIVYFTEVTA